MRLALYAHNSSTDDLAEYVFFCLKGIRDLGFQICFISNSPIPESRETRLTNLCDKVIQRENTGFDFAMWKQGLESYDLSQFDELLLTNSSIVGPLRPLAPLWIRSEIQQCDFWGLTDNDEQGRHLQSYFLVFRKRVLHSPCFMDFWHSVLPYKDKQQIIQSYEVGLTMWLEENGFKWEAVISQSYLHSLYRSRQSLVGRLINRIQHRRPPRNTSMLLPDLLMESEVPFLKVSLLHGRSGPTRVDTSIVLGWLESSDIPVEVLEEMRSVAANAGRS